MSIEQARTNLAAGEVFKALDEWTARRTGRATAARHIIDVLDEAGFLRDVQQLREADVLRRGPCDCDCHGHAS